MQKLHARTILMGAVLAVGALALALHGCREQPTEPAPGRPGAPSALRRLVLRADGSTTSGRLGVSRGELSCTVTHASGRVSTAGACESSYPSGVVVVVTAVPPDEGGSVRWTGCDHAHTDDPLACRVSMDADRTITAAFAPPPSTYVLTVQGRTGRGVVRSSPAGIVCELGSREPQPGCRAEFPASAAVTLSATSADGKPLKAWAGGGCEASGDGLGSTRGRCTLTMSRTHTVVVSVASEVNEAVLGAWDAPIAWPHVAIHAAMLPNGKVMTWGRRSGVPVLWNPAAPGTFTTLARPADFFCTGHAYLGNGRLILTGGHDGAADFGLRKTYTFNHDVNKWIAGKRMANGRWYPTTTTLPSGQVLTISGGDTAGALNRIPEVRLSNGNWRALTSAERAVPYYPMMFIAPNGRVFMAGPEQQTAYLNVAGAGTWTPGPTSNFGDRSYGSAVMYDAGKILLVGGNEANPTSSAEVLNLTASGAAWRTVDAMSVPRRQHNATILADGTVLVTGGTDAPGFNSPPSDDQVLTPELWNPDTEEWTELSPMAHHRLYHSVTLLLPDGRVLSAGSGEPAAQGQPDDLTAEIFTPPYLFNPDGTPATRPTVSSAPVAVGYGQTFTVGTPDAASIAKVVWVRLGSVTHSFDQNQRANRLTFSVASPTSLAVVAPQGRNHAPPGHYMLFIVNDDGVPSVAKFVRIP